VRRTATITQTKTKGFTIRGLGRWRESTLKAALKKVDEWGHFWARFRPLNGASVLLAADSIESLHFCTQFENIPPLPPLANMEENEPPELPEYVTLCASCLLSKWGFEDGDLLSFLNDWITCDRRAVLVELVKRKLLPALKQQVEFEVIETNHNPIRALTVDGQDVTMWHFESLIDCPVKFEPESVEVPGWEVLEFALNLQGITTPKMPERLGVEMWEALIAKHGVPAIVGKPKRRFPVLQGLDAKSIDRQLSALFDSAG
jgi:hypothetical protein